MLKILDEVHGLTSTEDVIELSRMLVGPYELLSSFHVLSRKVESLAVNLFKVYSGSNEKLLRDLNNYCEGIYKRLEFYSVLILGKALPIRPQVSCYVTNRLRGTLAIH